MIKKAVKEKNNKNRQYNTVILTLHKKIILLKYNARYVLFNPRRFITYIPRDYTLSSL